MDRPQPPTRSPMGRRFALYFAGVAIGLLMLGFFQIMRGRSQRAIPAAGPGGAATTPASPDPAGDEATP